MPPDIVDASVPVACEEISTLLSAQEVVALNQAVTDPVGGDMVRSRDDIPDDVEPLTLPLDDGIDVDRDEDFHHLRDPAVVETLVDQILPRECAADDGIVPLYTVVLSHLARGQAFVNGNKRTAYLAATLFLIKAQAARGQDEARYLRLDDAFTDTIAAVARGEMGRAALEDYVRDRFAD